MGPNRAGFTQGNADENRIFPAGRPEKKNVALFKQEQLLAVIHPSLIFLSFCPAAASGDIHARRRLKRYLKPM